MYDELLDYVDENDTIIGTTEKHKIYDKKLINRICHVIVINSEGKIALQKRSQHVSFMPGAWCTSAGGHVSAGDDYESSAKRELEEEIGIKGELKYIDKYLFNSPINNHRYFTSLYETYYDGEFKCCEREVEFVKFFSKKEIKQMIENGEKMHPEVNYIFENYYL